MHHSTSSMVPSDKRSQVRLPCQLPVDPHLASGRATSDHLQGITHDLSAGGVGLVLSERLEPGSRLVFEVPARGGSRPWEVRVVHAENQRDGTWLHGCAAAQELSGDDLLEALLAG